MADDEILTKNQDGDQVTAQGYGVVMATFFIVAQMAGAGFLSLPRALADTGWLGIVMIIIFCGSIAFTGVRLGKCWVILEERWPDEYFRSVRQPYMEIAYRALGNVGRKVSLVCILITLIGSTIVFIILMAGMLNTMLPGLSQCQFTIIVAFSILPLTWLGSPKDFWQLSIFAVITTVVAVVVITYKIISDYHGIEAFPPIIYPNPTVTSFAFGFGAILFSFGGCSVFPTIQNDMRNRREFWKSILAGFMIILSLYLPVALIGYVYIGYDVNSNILLSVDPSYVVLVAMVMEIFNLVGTFLICLSPVVLSLEDILNISPNFGWKRVVLRSSLIFLEVIVALAIPDFGLILNLIGGSTITCLSFILPPIMYIKLADAKVPKHIIQRSIPTWERIFLWEIILVGIVGGLTSTITAFFAILDPSSFGRSCFVNFCT